MEIILEVIAFDILSCGIAEKEGAHRIELCASPEAGGTTPSVGMIRKARDLVNIDLFPIIRPRGGDFLYSDAEFQIMRSDIRMCRDLGCNGVVAGMLSEEGHIDTDRMALLVEEAYPMDVTFHRAFDACVDPFKGLEDIIGCGCTRILTSGQAATAQDGIDLIRRLVAEAAGRICIMPGSGIRASNLLHILRNSGSSEVHSSVRTLAPAPAYPQRGPVSETHATLDVAELRRMIDLIRAYPQTSGNQPDS